MERAVFIQQEKNEHENSLNIQMRQTSDNVMILKLKLDAQHEKKCHIFHEIPLHTGERMSPFK